VLSQPLSVALSFLEIADTWGRDTTGMTTPSSTTIARLKEVRNFGAVMPKIRALSEATYFSGLRKAGMPEE
jgi:hypothetical protein